LTRWLRCLLTREFSLDSTLKAWDFIFADSYASFQDKLRALDYLSVAMIHSKREELMESEYSMCLGLLMSYKEPEDFQTEILAKAVLVSTCLQEGRRLVVESEPAEEEDNMLKSSDEELETQESPATPEPQACLQ
jgi:hypothetical protein